MPVLIDGNNLLYAARRLEETGPEVGRTRLCHLLGQWAERRRERVHVVFDGPEPKAARAGQIAHPAIRVSYSGRQSADAEVIKILETDSAARRLVVVSSDHEIRRAARRRRARVMRSDEFWTLVKQDLSRPPPRRTEPAEKRRGLGPEATEAWLREFGFSSGGKKPET